MRPRPEYDYPEREKEEPIKNYDHALDAMREHMGHQKGYLRGYPLRCPKRAGDWPPRAQEALAHWPKTLGQRLCVLRTTTSRERERQLRERMTQSSVVFLAPSMMR